MSERITDSIRLMGLIVTTKPHEYTDNIVTCNYETHVDLDDIKTLRSSIASERDKTSAEYTDEQITSFNDDIYFLDKIIETLQGNI